MADKKKTKWSNWEKKRRRIKGRLNRGNFPRMVVYRSNRNIFVQIVDDLKGHTLVSASTNDKGVREQLSDLKNGVEKGKAIGKIIGELAIKNSINQIVFDRNGYKYHGVIKAVAESAREAGLKF